MAQLPLQVKSELVELLCEYKDVFDWSADDIPRILRHIIEHKLGINLKFRPVKQKKRWFHPERLIIIDNKVEKLMRA